jgi:hypothetical protein
MGNKTIYSWKQLNKAFDSIGSTRPKKLLEILRGIKKITGKKDNWTWEQINTSLTEMNYSPKDIVKLLSALKNQGSLNQEGLNSEVLEESVKLKPGFEFDGKILVETLRRGKSVWYALVDKSDNNLNPKMLKPNQYYFEVEISESTIKDLIEHIDFDASYYDDLSGYDELREFNSSIVDVIDSQSLKSHKLKDKMMFLNLETGLKKMSQNDIKKFVGRIMSHMKEKNFYMYYNDTEAFPPMSKNVIKGVNVYVYPTLLLKQIDIDESAIEDFLDDQKSEIASERDYERSREASWRQAVFGE